MRRVTPHIVADTFERQSGIPAMLERLGARVEVKPLAAGDYFFADGRLVERKRVRDLEGALLQGRFWKQVTRLRQSTSHAYVLVEGASVEPFALRGDAVRGACLHLSDHGVIVLRTINRLDSARWLFRIAARAAASSRSRRRDRELDPST